MEQKTSFYVALLEGKTPDSAMPVVAVNDPALVRLVIDYLTKRVEPRDTQTQKRAQ